MADEGTTDAFPRAGTGGTGLDAGFVTAGAGAGVRTGGGLEPHDNQKVKQETRWDAKLNVQWRLRG